MSTKRVRAGECYYYHPVPYDEFMDPPRGVQEGFLHVGDKVKVVSLAGCPPANTMGMCHIQTTDGQIAGLVYTNSLRRKGVGDYGKKNCH